MRRSDIGVERNGCWSHMTKLVCPTGYRVVIIPHFVHIIRLKYTASNALLQYDFP